MLTASNPPIASYTQRQLYGEVETEGLYTDIYQHQKSNIPGFPPSYDPEKLRRQPRRWGEYDQVDGNFPLKNDHLCRFRSNFKCCHVVPLEANIKTLEGYMLPKPLAVDIGSHEIGDSNKTRWVPLSPTQAVFPVNDARRKDASGEYVLLRGTRNALNDIHRGIYLNSTYEQMFHSFPKDICKKARHLRENHIQRTRYMPRSNTEDTEHQPESKMGAFYSQEGQFKDLSLQESQFPVDLSRMSWLQACRERDYLLSLTKKKKRHERLSVDSIDGRNLSPLTQKTHVSGTEGPEVLFQYSPSNADAVNQREHSAARVSNLQRVPGRLELLETENYVPENIEPYSCMGSESDTEETSEDEEEDGMNDEDISGRIPCRLGRRFKNDAHQRFHQRYPQKVPDLRDNHTTSKRVKFYGFYSSTFR